MNSVFQSVLDAPLFKDINVTDTEYVLSKFSERFYPKDKVLFQQGDPGLDMYVVKSGSLKIFRESEGKELILGHQFPGETIGELEVIHSNNLRLASVATLEKTILWSIHKTDLEELMNIYPQILRKLFYVVSERLDQADRKLDYLAFLDTRIRMANLLLDLYSNFGIEDQNGFLIKWKVTHQYLGLMIGVTRESVTLALKELQTKQIIIVHNKYITITNLVALKQLANDQQDSHGSREWHPSHKYGIN